jgi:transcriptional regulator with XRE-family HTH domain
VTINQRLFDLLASKDKSQKELSIALGISERNISAWKARGSEPPSNLIPAIAAFFDVSMEWMLTGEEQQKGTLVVSGCASGNAIVQGINRGSVVVRNGRERPLSDEAAELLRIYESLDMRRRLKLLDTALNLEDEILKGENSNG